MPETDRSSTDEVDVLIVGAGMAGGVLARRLGEAGMSVVVLEQGRHIQPTEIRSMYDTWELDRSRRWSVRPNTRDWPEDYPVGGESDMRMFNAVGGSLNHWAGHWPRLKPCDFRKGTEHGLAPDWPISYEDLEPYYDRADRMMGIAGRLGDPAYPPRSPRSTKAIPLGGFGQRIAGGFERLGWHWWWLDNAIITERYDGRQECNSCGLCILGCPRGSMSTSATSFFPQAIAHGVQLRTECRVERVVTDNGRAVGAEYVDITTGERHRQDARIVVVACNGVGTARLLLLSDSAEHPDGLANSNGLVGKNLMFHPQAFVEALFDEPMEDYKGGVGAPLFSHEFYETDPSRGFVNGWTSLLARAPGAGLAAMGHWVDQPVPWGAGHHAAFAERFNHHAYMILLAEDLPLERNRVTLDPELRDSSGLPAPHVAYRMHEQDKRLVEFAIERTEELFDAAGARVTTHSGAMDQPPGYHLLGTARMGDDPATSVTNRWHQTWDVPNLFVCDGSSFVTSAGVNPTSTIAALALRLGDHLVREARTIVGGARNG